MLVKQRITFSNYLHALAYREKPNKEPIDRTKKMISLLDKNIKPIEERVESARKETVAYEKPFICRLFQKSDLTRQPKNITNN
jgi:hypothetical protein